MIRIPLASAALAALLSSGAIAQDAATKADAAKSTGTTVTEQGSPEYFTAVPEQVLASAVLGKTVYTGADEQGEAIGDVNDVVIDAHGGAEALVIGVGGFLGLGEKDVAINFDRVSWSDRDGQRIIVVSATKEELQAAPEFDRKALMGGVAATTPEEESTTAAAAPSVTESEGAQPAQPMTGTTPQMTDPDNPQIDPGTTASNPSAKMKLVDPASVGADKLIGADVKVADNTKVGEIGDVILGKDGKVDAYVIDVGGFLGVGQKPVAMSAESVRVTADASGTMVIHSPFTRAQLKSQPAYDQEAYKADPRGVVLGTPAN